MGIMSMGIVGMSVVAVVVSVVMSIVKMWVVTHMGVVVRVVNWVVMVHIVMSVVMSVMESSMVWLYSVVKVSEGTWFEMSICVVHWVAEVVDILMMVTVVVTVVVIVVDWHSMVHCLMDNNWLSMVDIMMDIMVDRGMMVTSMEVPVPIGVILLQGVLEVLDPGSEVLLTGDIVAEGTALEDTSDLLDRHQAGEVLDIIHPHEGSEEVELLSWIGPVEGQRAEAVVHIAWHMGVKGKVHDSLAVFGATATSHLDQVVLEAFQGAMDPSLSIG